MKESHSEGVANHADLESCGEPRKGLAEALTGESTGRAIEPRKYIQLRDADAQSLCGRQHPRRRYRKVPRGPARPKTLARGDALCTGTGRSGVRPRRRRAASGSLTYFPYWNFIYAGVFKEPLLHFRR